MNSAADRPLEQELLAAGMLSEDQLRIVRQEQSRTGQSLGRLLVELGFVSESAWRQAISLGQKQPGIDLAHATVDPLALRRVPRELARRHRLLPLDYDPIRRRLMLAMADPGDLPTLDKIRHLQAEPLEITPLLAGEAEIGRAIDRCYGHELSIDGILREIETGEIDWYSQSTAEGEYRQPIVRLVDAILTDAVKREASDIHFEPEAAFLRIRYRIDGLLRQIRVLHKSCWPAMTVRLKVMAGMNIAEMRAPQDGRIGMSVSGRSIDFRVASQPTLHGENLVLRILDRHKGIVALSALGLTAAQEQVLKQIIARPAGIILVTGPTGSGKTTSLYSILQHINHEGIHIMTLEDPVEYPLPLIRQTSVAEAAKLDFANGIRSMMRQDPDVILVGEIRDGESASMALQAAMTGHQVYSTLHTNSAAGAIPRLLDIGIPPDIMAGNIIGIVAQRLLRCLCPHCRQADEANADELRLLALPANAPPPRLFRPRGCEHCDFTGYRGRQAIMEILRIDEDLDELIARRASAREITAHARRRGFVTLAEDGLSRVLAGTTSIAELQRVVDLTERM